MTARLHLLRLFRRWHARIGFTAMLFFLVLAATGFVLNHASDLGLDARYVHSVRLARWYGIEVEVPRRAFRSGAHALIAANGRWLFDGSVSGDELPPPVGLAEFGGMVAVASEIDLRVFDSDRRLIDRLDSSALPAVPIEAIGANAEGIVLKTPSGTFASEDALSWKRARAAGVFWSVPVEVSADERRACMQALAPGISVERLLQDAHSGRLFGRYWSGLELPRHLIQFTPQTMRAMVERAGGEIVRAFHKSKPRYLIRSLRFRLRNGGGPLAGEGILKLALELVLPLARATGRGEAVRFFIRRSGEPSAWYDAP